MTKWAVHKTVHGKVREEKYPDDFTVYNDIIYNLTYSVRDITGFKKLLCVYRLLSPGVM